jgi:hypothetical protein
MDQNHSELPGRFGRVTFPITASLILGALCVVVIWLFCEYPTQRITLKFGIETVTLAAGMLSAYYIGQGLFQTVTQLEKGLKDAQIITACRFMERWNAPDLAATKGSFRGIIESGKAHDAGYVQNLLSDDGQRTVVVEVLNFFEEVALSANIGLADDATLSRYFGGALRSYHTTLSPWIQTHRASKARPKMWCEIDNLLHRWQ